MTWKSVLPFAKIVASVGLLSLLLFKAKGLFAAGAPIPDQSFLLAAFAVYVLNVLISAWRWQMLLQAIGISIGITSLTRTLIVGLFFNNFFPSSIGGDIYRIQDTARAAGSALRASLVVAINRIFGLAAALLMATVAVAVRWDVVRVQALGLFHARPELVRVSFVAITLLLTLSIFLWTRLDPKKKVALRAKAASFIGLLGEFRRRPFYPVMSFGGACAVHLLIALYYLCVARALGVNIPFVILATVLPIAIVLQAAPISMNGLGVREASIAYFLQRIGNVPIEKGAFIALTGSLGILLFSCLGAPMWLLRKPREEPED
jgi:uncharacterized membrane protein YbhN (UPF0104 family)